MNSKRLLEIFLKITSINGLSGNEKPIADFIRSFLADYKGFDITEDSSGKISGSNTGNLIIKVGNGGDKVLVSHMDTARPTSENQPRVLEDRIVSNGSGVLGVDNRAGVAILLYTLEKSLSNGSQNNFTVAFTTCEETTLLGSKNLKLNGSVKKGFVFDSFLRPGNFINRAPGAKGFKVSVFGKASHSGIAPEKGINSIAVTAKALSMIVQGRIDDNTTVNIGTIEGGSAVNVVPEKTSIEGEVRSFDAECVNVIIDKIRDRFETEATNAGASIQFDSVWDFEPYEVNPDSDVYRELSVNLKKIGLSPRPTQSLGGSDANSLNANGIPSINIGIGAQNPHSNDEFILLEDLIKSTELALALTGVK